MEGKGDIASCSTCRLIRLISHTLKVVDQWLWKIVNITPNQGFVRNTSITDAVLLLVEGYKQKRKADHAAFLDLERAFDRVS